MKRMKRWICMIIALCMVAGLMPVNTLLLHTHAEEGVTSCADDVHMWDEGEQTQEPTAEAPGVRTFTCTQCGETRNEEIPYEAPVCSHIWDEGEETQEPTAEAPGVRTFTCTQCGETRNEEIPYEAPVCNHQWDDGTNSETGVIYTCILCGTCKKEPAQPICEEDAHIWDVTTGIQEEIEKTSGVITYTCQICGASKEESEPVPDTQGAKTNETTIDETNFPDEIFRNYVARSFDADSNESLSDSERLAVTQIFVPDSGITSLAGIEFFPNVFFINCAGNRLTTLDLSQNTLLEDINCSGNRLSDLDVSSNVMLTTLDCSKNKLTDLNTSSNSALDSLRCDYNQLSYLDASHNDLLTTLTCSYNQLVDLCIPTSANLSELDCSNNQLTFLDLSNGSGLTALRCAGNRLNELDVSNCTDLEQLFCSRNQLRTLNVSSNGELTSLDCDGNKLTSLDLSQNHWLKTLNCSANQLTYLDVSKNIGLTSLYCETNRLTSLDLRENTSLYSYSIVGNTYEITLDQNRTFDVSTLPGNFDVAKAMNWTSGYIEGTIFYASPDGDCAETQMITYEYQVRDTQTARFIWAVQFPHTPDPNRIQMADYTECGGGWTVDYTNCAICNDQCTLDGRPLDWNTYHKDGNSNHTPDLDRIQKADYTECGGGWIVDYTNCTVCNNQCTLDGSPLDWETHHKDGNSNHTPDPGSIQKADYTECAGGWTVDRTSCTVCREQCTLDGAPLDRNEHYKEGTGVHNPDSDKFLEPTYTTCGGGYVVGYYLCADCGRYCKADGSELDWDTDSKPGDGKHTPNKTTIYQPDYTPCNGGYVVSYYKCSVCGAACKADGSELSATDYKLGNGKHTPDMSTFHEASYFPCSGGYRQDYYECSVCNTICDSTGSLIMYNYEPGNGKHQIDSNGVCEICGNSITFGTCGENLTWKIENGVLIISGTGDMYDYSQQIFDSAPWLSWKDNFEREITSVKVEEGVTSIGAGAFQCPDITSVEISSTVKKIGDLAFAWCSDLKTITFAGSAPDFGTANRVFLEVFATAYYPANDPTWTDAVKKNYGGNIKWVGQKVSTELDLSGTPLEHASAITIDGKQYSGQDLADGVIDLKRTDAKTAVVYSYNGNSSDPHQNYPTGMKVYRLEYAEGGYQVTAVPELDNLLQYNGSSIRMTGNKGIRMITGVPAGVRNQLISAQVAGYTLEEYGTVLAFADKIQGGSLTLTDSYAKSNYAYKRGISDAVYANTSGLTQYTNVLVGFTMEQCSQDIAMRPYIKLKDASGELITIYGGIVYRSIGYIAWQNRDTFPAGSDGYRYIWEIIQAVYKGSYPSD